MAIRSKPTTLANFVAVGVRSLLTLGVAGMAGAALVFGVGVLNDRAAAVPEPQGSAPVPVSVATLRLEQGYSIGRRFVGQIEANATVSLSFELSGKIESLLVEEGDHVIQGQKIAILDTDLLKADMSRLNATRAAAEAQLVSAQARLARALKLQEQGFTSQETLEQALAKRDELVNRIAETDAALNAVSINLSKSELYAPFSGQVASQAADQAETIRAGQEIITIMEIGQSQFRVGLPLNVDAKSIMNTTVEVAGRALPATLQRVRPDIDPVTRTRTVIFDIASDASVLFGQTASLLLETKVEAEGAWLALDALQSGKGGVWTVMIVVDDRLARASAEILHIEGPKAFVRGSFEAGAQIVTSGAHRVVAGQAVTSLNTGAE